MIIMIWSPNLCRLCGVISPTTHSVLKLSGTETIEFKIKKCLNLSIYKDDCKPKEICEQCLFKLEQYSDYFDICTSTNQKFDSILGRNPWPPPPIKEPSVTDYIQPKSVIVNMKNCIENLHNESVDILPLENINVPMNEEVLQIVDNSNGYSTNIQDNIGEYINTSSKYVQYFSECSNTVLRHSSNIDNLQLSTNTFSEQNFSYNYSQKINQNSDSAEKHCTDYLNIQPVQLPYERGFHNGIAKRDFNGDVCVQNQDLVKSKSKQILISVDSVKDKLNLKEGSISTTIKVKKNYNCPHCDKVFIRRISLNSHIALHTKNKPYTCSNCGKSFAVRSELTVHKKIHSDQYQCRICLKTFVVPSKLKRHFRTHTKEKPFQCNFDNCGKKFSDRSNLAEHENIHGTIRTLHCDKCDKCFKTKSQLRSHRLCHNFGVCFTCDICEKSYKYKTNLILHMKTHTGFRCSYCKMNCGKLSALVKHSKECYNKGSYP